MQSINLAIVGGTGAVGKKVLEILERNEVPLNLNQLRVFASQKSAGSQISFKGEKIPVELTDPGSFGNVDLAIFSAGSSVSKAVAPAVADQGTIVIDNSSAFRMDKDVPLIAAGVNDQDIKNHPGIIANPNCSTIQMVYALKPIYDKVGIKRIVVSTYQAVSGTGDIAIEELHTQSLDVLNGKDIEKLAYPHQIAFNLIPHIDDFDEVGNSKEELKMVHETHKILSDHNIKITATTVRVPVFIGHSESLYIETEQKLSRTEAIQLLHNTPEVIVIDEPGKNQYPTPVDVVGKNEVYIGRIREDLGMEKGLNMWVVADNLRRGAAYNALKIGEFIVNNKLI